MRQRKLYGFTLIEVLVSFVLISFIVVMVCSVMTSGYAISARLHELPNAYYELEDEAEQKMDELSPRVQRFIRLNNEIGNTAGGLSGVDPAVAAEWYELKSELDAIPKETVSLFGKTVEIYKLDVDSVVLALNTAVISAEMPEREKPIITEVVIKPEGSSSVLPDVYFAKGQTVKATVEYDPDTTSLKYDKDFYQWYIGTGDYHTSQYTDGPHVKDEPRSGTIYTDYPFHYDILPGETAASIRIKDEYCGQFLVCVVTPLGKNGAMGESKASNPLYVSALPQISNGKYRMYIDVSAEVFRFTEASTLEITNINNRAVSGVQGRFVYGTDGNKPKVNLDGAPTDTKIANAPSLLGTYTRYISFDGATYMKSDNFWGDIINPHAFVVVRNNEAMDVDFITVKDDQNSSLNIRCGLREGNPQNIRKTDGSGDTGWQIIEVKLNSGNTNIKKGVITIGRARVDVAEFIVVGNAEASASERNSIWAYLLEKYNIKENP